MVTTVLRVVEINPNYAFLLLVVFIIMLFFVSIYFIWLSAKKDNLSDKQRMEKLKILQEFTQHGSKTSSWLKEHKEELQKQPIATLNNQEFVSLVNRGQELYERILDIYPDYPDTVMPPKELRQYFIELAQGQHRQTH